jgi:hypothetical protein
MIDIMIVRNFILVRRYISIKSKFKKFVNCKLVLMEFLGFFVCFKNKGLFKSPYHYERISIFMLGCAHFYKTIISRVA